jgi:hypothetical protein
MSKASGSSDRSAIASEGEARDTERTATTPPARRRARRTRRRSKPPAAAAAASSRKVLVIGGLALLVALGIGAALLRMMRAEPSSPDQWSAGDVVDVLITLVAADRQNLACASEHEVGGKHCGFESPDKPWSKASGGEGSVLMPYTTVDRAHLLGAGLWSQPALAAPLPTTRFHVRCKLAVEGKLKDPSIRWAPRGPWLDQTGEWSIGTLSECVVEPVAGVGAAP